MTIDNPELCDHNNQSHAYDKHRAECNHAPVLTRIVGENGPEGLAFVRCLWCRREWHEEPRKPGDTISFRPKPWWKLW